MLFFSFSRCNSYESCKELASSNEEASFFIIALPPNQTNLLPALCLIAAHLLSLIYIQLNLKEDKQNAATDIHYRLH